MRKKREGRAAFFSAYLFVALAALASVFTGTSRLVGPDVDAFARSCHNVALGHGQKDWLNVDVLGVDRRANGIAENQNVLATD